MSQKMWLHLTEPHTQSHAHSPIIHIYFLLDQYNSQLLGIFTYWFYILATTYWFFFFFFFFFGWVKISLEWSNKISVVINIYLLLRWSCLTILMKYYQSTSIDNESLKHKAHSIAFPYNNWAISWLLIALISAQGPQCKLSQV